MREKPGHDIFFRKRLVDRGFLSRHPSETNRRVMILERTPMALGLMPELTSIVQEVHEQLLQDFSEEEIKTFYRLVRRIIENSERQ